MLFLSLWELLLFCLMPSIAIAINESEAWLRSGTIMVASLFLILAPCGSKLNSPNRCCVSISWSQLSDLFTTGRFFQFIFSFCAGDSSFSSSSWLSTRSWSPVGLFFGLHPRGPSRQGKTFDFYRTGKTSDVCWFMNHEISPINHSYISTINHRIQLLISQLSYLGGPILCASNVFFKPRVDPCSHSCLGCWSWNPKKALFDHGPQIEGFHDVPC